VVAQEPAAKHCWSWSSYCSICCHKLAKESGQIPLQEHAEAAERQEDTVDEDVLGTWLRTLLQLLCSGMYENSTGTRLALLGCGKLCLKKP
jgi:hypothetical protein